MIDTLKNLPISRYGIRLTACEDTICHPILGSALRGAFGDALKDVSCTVRHRECQRCPLNSACHYTNIFEPQYDKDAPRPFTFQIPVPPLNPTLSVEDSLKLRILKDKSLQFGFTLIGTDAYARLPYVIFAIDRMARLGIGMPRKEFRLTDVTSADLVIYDSQMASGGILYSPQENLGELCERRAAGIHVHDRLTIRFLTPVWLREERKLIEKPTFFHLVKFVLTRLANILSHYSRRPFDLNEREFLDRAREISVTNENLWRHDFEFYSNRRRRIEHQSGILGELTVAGNGLETFLPLLAAGEILHIGSKTSFGLGRYEVL